MIVKLVRLNDIGCYFTEIALHTITAHAHTGVFKNYLQKLGGRWVVFHSSRGKACLRSPWHPWLHTVTGLNRPEILKLNKTTMSGKFNKGWTFGNLVGWTLLLPTGCPTKHDSSKTTWKLSFILEYICDS